MAGGKGYPSEVWAKIVDSICRSLAAQTIEGSCSQMIEKCANNGQLTIIDNTIPDFQDQEGDIAEGNFSEVTSSHDEAVGEIVSWANYRCMRAAQVAAELRATV